MQTQYLSSILQNKFIGVDDFRRELSKILEKLPQEGGELVITQHGKPQAILIDLESYLELQEQIQDADNKLINRVNQAVSQAKKDKGIEAKEVFKNLGI